MACNKSGSPRRACVSFFKQLPMTLQGAAIHMTSANESPQAALAISKSIFAREGVLNAFGHVSIRNPTNPSNMYLARSLAPELVTESDILEFDLVAQPVRACHVTSERMIHTAIYQMRSDVSAICHHHAPALPFCLVNLALHVVTQLGAAIGKHVGAAQPLLHLIFESLPFVRSAPAVTQCCSCVRCKRFDRQIQCEEIDFATTFPEATLARAWDLWRMRFRS